MFDCLLASFFTDKFTTEAFLKRMTLFCWKAYSQIYTRGIEKEKDRQCKVAKFITMSLSRPIIRSQRAVLEGKRLHSPLRIHESLEQL